MLKEFYDYVKKHKNYAWVHWNMRNINYGFAALEHRCKVLGGTPIEIHESCRYDLHLLLKRLYGDNYIDHPRLGNLVEKNFPTHPHFLKGEEEAEAFENSEYLKLHQSTLCKVDILSDILNRTIDGSLINQAKAAEMYGNHLIAFIETTTIHWAFRLISFFAAFASIIGLLMCIF